MWQREELRLPARLLSQATRWVTGVEIHPGATIGRRLFIDHAMGVVIGETAEIGDDVMLYHGVTLGGRSMERVKRHPTLGDGVTVGAGARILGPITVGAGAQIGANAVVVKDVPAGAVVVGVPGRVITPDPTTTAEDRQWVDPAIFI
jgi:serine O-acetyltransferase